jgi:OOP family OmpA-OmpF porin
MTDASDRSAPASGPDSSPPPDRAAEFAQLRALLVGREQHAIAELQARLDAMGVTPEELAEQLPEAIALRAGQDEQLARALAPTLERAFTESVQHNPQQIAQAIYPTLGPAIRKAIAEAIAGLVTSINRALDSSLSLQGLQWRLEAWRSGVPYGQIVIKHALVYRVEQAYLIHGETGLLLAHLTAPDLAAPDADVIAGMMTAIRDFVGDSFEPRGEGGLKEFAVGDVTVLVEAGPKALLAAVVRGQHPPALRLRLQETLELLHLQLAGPLSRFDGDTAPFAAAQGTLAGVLETVVDTARPSRRRLVPRLAWVLVLLLVVVGSWVAIRDYLRWRRALAALDATPGIVVLEADRGWRSWRIDGLRDPLAAQPAAVVAGTGVDTTRLRGTWVPYVSADGPLVIDRARRSLATPEEVRLTLLGDTLTAEGVGPTDWIDRARARAAAIAGVGFYREVDLRPTVPSLVRPVADSLARTRVLFPVGAASLSEAARTTVARAATQWRALRAAVSAQWAVVLALDGRTDTTGSREVNRVLSDERADRVAAVLTDLGVPSAALRARGLGTSDPLPAADREARARVNRSVSFAIRLEPATPVQEPRP